MASDARREEPPQVSSAEVPAQPSSPKNAVIQPLGAEPRVPSRNERLLALAQASLAIQRAGTIEQLLQEVTDRARELVGAHQAVTSTTVNQNWAQAINAVSMSEKYAHFRGYSAPPDGSGIYAWVCETNRPVRMTQAELEAHPRWRGFGQHKAEHPPMRGWLAVPLVARDGRNLGLLQLSDKHEDEFDAEDEAILLQLAQLAAAAIENARLMATARESEELQKRRADQAALMADVGTALTRLTSTREMLQQCAEALVEHLDAAFARVWLLDPAENVLELQASAGLYTHLDGPHARVPVGAYKIGRIAERKEPHLTNDVLTDPRVSDREWARREGMVSFAGYPLVLDGRVVGVLALFARRPLPQDTLEMLAAVSDAVALGVERKRLETAQRQSEERLRTLVEATTAVVWTTDPNGQFTEDSPSWRGFTGQTLEDWRRGLWHACVHPDDRAAALDAWKVALAEKRPLQSEYRLKHQELGYRSVIARGTPVFERDGAIREWVGSIVDVTEMRRAESALRVQTELLRTISDNATQGLFMMDDRQRCTFMNPAAERITGFTFEEVKRQGKPLHDIIHHTHPDGRPFPIDDCPIDRALPTNHRQQGEGVFVHKDGRFYPVAFTASPIVERGRPVGTVIEVRDITEEKRAEEALRQSRERLLAALDASGTGTFRWDVRTNELDWDENLDRLFGLTPGKTARKLENFLAMVHPDDRGAVIQACEASARDGADFDMIFRVVWPDRSLRWLADKGKVFRGPDGRPAYMTGACVDITALKRGEVERERLIQALERTNAELDQFAYVASHDLKAPLRGIANLSQWIEEDAGPNLGPNVKEQLQLLRGRVHRMEALIDGILDYSRAGRIRHAAEKVDVGRLVREVVDLLSPPPEVQVSVGEEMPVLQTERVPLQQVFINLIGNAIKHARRDGARVEVQVRPAGAFHQFTVKDNGPGIAPEFHDKIWLIFQTLQPRDRVEGAGIGLSVVKKIVETRGGRAWVESAEGAGARFHFTWPVKDDGGMS